MSRSRPIVAVAVVTALLAPATLLAAGGSSAPSPSPSTPQLTPEQQAVAAYNQGLKQRDKAWKLEEEAAAAARESAREKLHRKALKAYARAIRDFRDAIDHNPDFYQAWSSLGYALRKSGEYEDSLAAYDRALRINPLYPEAIEYRGEAYLGLDRVEEAKAAYMELFRLDRERAAELMTAMKRWLEARRGSGGVPEETLDEFARWVEERTELAAQVGRLASAAPAW